MSTDIDRDTMWQQMGGDELYRWLDEEFVTPLSSSAARRARALRLPAADLAGECWVHVWANLDWYAERIEAEDYRVIRAALGRVIDTTITKTRDLLFSEWAVYRPAQIEKLLQHRYAGAAENDGEAVHVRTTFVHTSDRPAELVDLELAIDRLTDSQRRAVEARYCIGGGWTEIAQAVGVPEATLRKSYSRAMRKLVSLMSGYPTDMDVGEIAA